MVSRIGDGAAALGTTTVAMFVDERTVSGALVQSIALPTVTAGSVNQMTLPPMNPLLCLSTYQPGVPATVGMVTLSADGRYVSLFGMKVPLGTTWTSTTYSWTAARIDWNAVIDTSSYLTDHYAGDEFMNVVTKDGSAYWFSTTGTSSGTGYTVVSGMWGCVFVWWWCHGGG